MAAIYVGATLVASVEFRDPGNNLYDPATVTVVIKPPAGGQVTKTYSAGGNPNTDIVKDGTGQYHLLYPAPFPGPWTFGWTGRGPSPAPEVYAPATTSVLSRPT